MKTIVFFCIPAHGHTNPTLGVVRALTEWGHRVIYYSYEPFQEKILAAGAEFVACDAFDMELKLGPGAAARLGKDMAFSTRILVETTLALDETVCRDMAVLKPDCIVADSMAVWGKAVAWKLKIPFVSSTTTFAFNRHSAQIMPQGPGALVRLLLAMPAVSHQLRRLRHRGYPVKNILDILQNDDHTHTIVYTSRGFQPAADTFPPEYYAFVGPCVRPASGKVEKRRTLLVYVSMGTVNNDMEKLYRNCITALADSGMQGILSVGSQRILEQLGPLPSNVEAYPQVDQMAVLEQADVFLTHCGMNSVNEALYHGVPLLMLPKTTEQQGVANRVSQLGAGLFLESEAPGAIAAGLQRLVQEPSFRQQARTLAAEFQSCPGGAGAADKILQCCL